MDPLIFPTDDMIALVCKYFQPCGMCGKLWQKRCDNGVLMVNAREYAIIGGDVEPCTKEQKNETD